MSEKMKDHKWYRLSARDRTLIKNALNIRITQMGESYVHGKPTEESKRAIADMRRLVRRFP